MHCTLSGHRSAGGQSGFVPADANLMVTFFLMHFVETKRWQDIRKPGSQAEKGTFLVSARAGRVWGGRGRFELPLIGRVVHLRGG